jgi:hypothetical protein
MSQAATGESRVNMQGRERTGMKRGDGSCQDRRMGEKVSLCEREKREGEGEGEGGRERRAGGNGAGGT